MDIDIPDDAKVRAITDHNGNICGFVFGRQELPWPLINMITHHGTERMKGYHSNVSYKVMELPNDD